MISILVLYQDYNIVYYILFVLVLLCSGNKIFKYYSKKIQSISYIVYWSRGFLYNGRLYVHVEERIDSRLETRHTVSVFAYLHTV